MLLATTLAATSRYNDPFFVGIALVFFAFNVYCIYRCIRGGHWVMLILGFLFCGIFWWVGAFMSPNRRRVKRAYRYHA